MAPVIDDDEDEGSPVDDLDEEIGEESDVECDGEGNNDLDDDTDEDLNSELDLDLGGPDDSIGSGLEWSDRLHDVETELFYGQVSYIILNSVHFSFFFGINLIILA
ncbi:hypothetical protein PoB_000464900 [Plakobranchus ocellatus]|uniref:Uncharacterized protein n=1 Tax=Plakobranchus ocellatus TaxID=259542 RepID=A0AAV3Y7S3_9GAST|nr:hypothetical protein PoB_000464900 [Plakobranchus ocellatus]